MQDDQLAQWRHSHAFGQELKRPGESKTLIVIVITGLMMVVEIAAGVVYGSMALLADGLHMASHAAALSINAFAYIYARRHARDDGFSFGTGKVNTLGGFTGAVLLAGFALAMATESIARLVAPVPIAFNQAIAVAVVGLIVNGVSVLILEHRPKHADHAHGEHGHANGGHHPHHHHHDHNLVSAYLHVLADALTSLLAIFALLGAKYLGYIWMDPVMGVVGAILVARWSIGLLRATSHILLDKAAPEKVIDSVRASLEVSEGRRIVDLHVWSVGPDIYAAIVALVDDDPQPPDYYKGLLPATAGIVHVSIEVNAYAGNRAATRKDLKPRR